MSAQKDCEFFVKGARDLTYTIGGNAKTASAGRLLYDMGVKVLISTYAHTHIGGLVLQNQDPVENTEVQGEARGKPRKGNDLRLLPCKSKVLTKNNKHIQCPPIISAPLVNMMIDKIWGRVQLLPNKGMLIKHHTVTRGITKGVNENFRLAVERQVSLCTENLYTVLHRFCINEKIIIIQSLP
uniref:Integrator complex subunit 10 n=1 Tax=Salmo trutta TaxID=8032 RepID=A0A674BWL9_SALTR